ncbi:hypothetical protein GJ496_003243 [Pomphorhynchus laevis]|nr:hypothetical protein GJ496_003243 [Pomphorhynchus laevis]
MKSENQGYFEGYTSQPMPPPYSANYIANDPFVETPFRGLDDKNIRRGFIRKVFSILLVQLSITFGFTLMAMRFNKLHVFLKNNPGLYFASYIVFLVTYITLACCKNVARKTPWNYAFLGLLTLSMTYMMAMITSFHSNEIVVVALGITICVCFSVILFSMQTKYDFTGMIGPLFAASIALLIFGIIAIFTSHKIVHIVYGALGAILFSAFLAVDIQMIMGGRKYEINPEDYIFGALMLYLDIVYIFIYILSIFSSARGD